MTFASGTEQILSIPPGIDLILPVSEANLLATITVQNEAYGSPPSDYSAIAGLRNSLEAGGIDVLARITATGEPVGAGVCTIPSHQTTEIAGIGVRWAFRSLGIAGALTTRLPLRLILYF